MIVKETEAINFDCCVDKSQKCAGAYCMGWVPISKENDRGCCGRAKHTQ